MNLQQRYPEQPVPDSRSPRLLIIAPHGSYRTAPFIRAAQQLGLDVLIASRGKHSIVSEYARGLQIDFGDEEAALQRILQVVAEQPFCGIIGTDDVSTVLASRVAEKLGLPHNPAEAVRIARRKDLARTRLQESGVNIPQFRLLDLNQPLAGQIQDIPFPAVVKPVALSASRGVIRVDTTQELMQAVARIQAILDGEVDIDPALCHSLLLEQFIPGREVAVEGILYEGEFTILSLFDKPDALDGPFFEETYYITPSSLATEVQQAIHATVQAACRAYGLREGPVHAECRVNEAGVWVLEVAARTIGGLCGQLIQFGLGVSLEALVLAHAQGQRFEAANTGDAAGVLMIPIPAAGILKRVEGILAAQRVPLIEEVNIQIRDGYELVPLPESGSYLGFIFARGPTNAAVEAALRQAHACLNIVVGPLWKVQI